ncbi:hypothetical protein [Pedobacter sandarakinus]|uniref:hypothetical protein n=1 Tax=Pedobacter sandarakinus TaxID=353156 RepID=UPI002247E385|nr:hypothetical protein [Pedobacter sandarakinus]MCX2573550.1 hypothetical protein [Pedobacter sandarakinus]
MKKRKLGQNNAWLIAALVFIISSTAYSPTGLVNFDEFEGTDILVAAKEGAANCTSTVKLKSNGKFSHTQICFGVERTKGKFRTENDTIFFVNHTDQHHDEYYRFAIIGKRKIAQHTMDVLLLYHSKADKIPQELLIVQNNLFTKTNSTKSIEQL